MFIGFSVTIIVLWLAIDSLGLGIRCYMLGVVHILRNQYFRNFYRDQNQTSPTLRYENHFSPRFMLPCSLLAEIFFSKIG